MCRSTIHEFSQILFDYIFCLPFQSIFFSGYRILGQWYFPFSALNVPFHCYLVVLFLMRTEQLSYLSLCNGLFFSGPFANFLSLFSFQQFDYYVPRSSFSQVYLARVSWASWRICSHCLFNLEKFLTPMSFPSPSRIPTIYMLDNLILFHRPLQLYSFFFSLILFFVSFGLDIVPFVQSPKLIFSPAMCSL